MATTYTTNYNLGKQENHADKFDMDVITDNADKIDAALTGLQSGIDGKQAALTTEQLAAVNSGVTSTDVAQIGLNKNNISLLEHANGQKNILRYNAADVANTTVGGRVVPTVNSDGSISLSGTAGSSAEVIRIARVNNDTAIKTGNYLYGNTVSGIRILIQTAGSPYTIYATGTENGALIQDLSDNITVDLKLYIDANKNCDGIIFYPMIQTADMHSAGFTDYQPYAMTNAELTAAIQALQAQLANQ